MGFHFGNMKDEAKEVVIKIQGSEHAKWLHVRDYIEAQD